MFPVHKLEKISNKKTVTLERFKMLQETNSNFVATCEQRSSKSHCIAIPLENTIQNNTIQHSKFPIDWILVSLTSVWWLGPQPLFMPSTRIWKTPSEHPNDTAVQNACQTMCLSTYTEMAVFQSSLLFQEHFFPSSHKKLPAK